MTLNLSIISLLHLNSHLSIYSFSLIPNSFVKISRWTISSCSRHSSLWLKPLSNFEILFWASVLDNFKCFVKNWIFSSLSSVLKFKLRISFLKTFMTSQRGIGILFQSSTFIPYIWEYLSNYLDFNFMVILRFKFYDILLFLFKVGDNIFFLELSRDWSCNTRNKRGIFLLSLLRRLFKMSLKLVSLNYTFLFFVLWAELSFILRVLKLIDDFDLRLNFDFDPFP